MNNPIVVSLAICVLAFSSPASRVSATPRATPTPPDGGVYAHGSGLVGIDVDFATGRVRRVWMIVSTGHRDLDEATISAFRRWHYKPRTLGRVQVPITFRIKGRAL